MANPSFVPSIRQVQLRYYKSIAAVKVDLGPMTVLVGPNGSGKSNFIEALEFVKDSLATSVDFAFKQHGGISAVRRISTGHPTHVGIRLIIDLAPDMSADYAFEIASKPGGQFEVAEERCLAKSSLGKSLKIVEFLTKNGEFEKDKAIPGIRPRLVSDRLALFSAEEEFPAWPLSNAANRAE